MKLTINIPIVGTEFVDVESAVLSDPDGVYGIRRVDTGATVVAANTAMTLGDDDNYEYEFEGIEAGVEYEVWYALTYEGDTFYVQEFFNDDEEIAPSSKTISFVCVIAGEVAALEEAPVLSSPGGNYGIRRLDTNATVVANNVALTLVGTALYQKTFVQPANDLKYKYYVRVALDDGRVLFVPSTTVTASSTMLAVGRYTHSVNVAARYGVDNMHLWLSSPQDDKDEPVDYALRAYEFIARAERYIDDKVAGPYVANAYGLDDAEVPGIITDLATRLAGVLMYEARGVDDISQESGEPVHRLRYEKREVDKQLKQIALGMISAARVYSETNTFSPTVGGDEVFYTAEDSVNDTSATDIGG
jgi:hypothetical protein